jgi:penicillin-binding protein 1A
MGIKSHLEPGLALTLGASEVTLLELTSAYGTFANSGIWVEPIFIIKIEDRSNVMLYKSSINENRALDNNIAAVMVDLMKGVLIRGTGVRGRIDRPSAAKTGTTQEFRDAWFIGFVPQLVTGVWAGNDDNTPMQGVAEVAVCPRIWKDYNQIALAGQPALDFPKPEGLINVQICVDSGKLAGPNCPENKKRWATYWRKDAPADTCSQHESTINTTEDEGINELPEGY